MIKKEASKKDASEKGAGNKVQKAKRAPKIPALASHTADASATLTGGHVMPHGKPHGFMNSGGPHAGNLPNLIVRKDGTALVELYSGLVSLTDGPANLLDADGATLIIHENEDDHDTQPIGGAGGRVACGVITAG